MTRRRQMVARLRKAASTLTLRQQVGLATVVLCLALVAVMAAGASYVGREQARQYVGNEMAELARTVADRLDRGMSNRMQDAVLLSGLDPLRNIWTGDADAVRPALEQLQEKTPFIAWVGFAGRDGTVRAATGGLLEGESVLDRPWFRHGQSGVVAEDVHEAEMLASLLPPSADGSTYRFIDIAAPVMDRYGNLAGVLGMHLSWDWAADLLNATLATIDPETQTEIWILSRDGQVLYGPEVGATPFPPHQRAAMKRTDSGAFLDETTAESALTGYSLTHGMRNYPGLGWIVVARRPANIAYAGANAIVTAILGLGLIVAAIGIGIATLISGSLSKPIRRLTDEADRIGRDPGSFMFPHVQGSVEVAQLSTALRSLLRRIDVTEQEKAAVEERSAEQSRKLNEDIDALKELADTDPLTRLPNRRGMVAFSQDVMSTYQRDGRPFSVLVVDIDHFKRVNDTYGHAVGDDVIRHVAAVVARSVRPSDRVARFGGEEFVAVLRDAPLVRAGEIAERIRASAESEEVSHGADRIRVTVSVGVAVISAADRDIQDVIERADLALYAAKSAGRNRVSLRAPTQLAEDQAA